MRPSRPPSFSARGSASSSLPPSTGEPSLTPSAARRWTSSSGPWARRPPEKREGSGLAPSAGGVGARGAGASCVPRQAAPGRLRLPQQVHVLSLRRLQGEDGVVDELGIGDVFEVEPGGLPLGAGLFRCFVHVVRLGPPPGAPGQGIVVRQPVPYFGHQCTPPAGHGHRLLVRESLDSIGGP